ncbi:MAG: four helix bundle protein [Bacteroidales bacterium]
MDNDATQNVSFFRFEDLRVYHKSLDYTDWVYNAVKKFPETQPSRLADKFINSAQAISFYIAEGSSRNKSQFVHYLKLAKSSIRECVILTTICEKQNLFDMIAIDESRNELMELTKMTGALIGSLQKTNGRAKNKHYQKDKNFDDYNYDADSDELITVDTTDYNKY